MNCCRETVEMAVPPGNPARPRDWIRGVLEQYVAGSETRGRPEGQSDPRLQQAIHEISGLATQLLQTQCQTTKKAESVTPHFLRLNQDIVGWSLEVKCRLK
jgi:hypothetical protein